MVEWYSLREIKILINAEIMGTCSRSKVIKIVNTLKQRRRQYDEMKESKLNSKRINDPNYTGKYRGFSNQVSIVYDSEYKELRIRTDAGRAFRPLLVVKNNQLVLEAEHIRKLLDPKSSYRYLYYL